MLPFFTISTLNFCVCFFAFFCPRRKKTWPQVIPGTTHSISIDSDRLDKIADEPDCGAHAVGLAVVAAEVKVLSVI